MTAISSGRNVRMNLTEKDWAVIKKALVLQISQVERQIEIWTDLVERSRTHCHVDERMLVTAKEYLTDLQRLSSLLKRDSNE